MEHLATTVLLLAVALAFFASGPLFAVAQGAVEAPASEEATSAQNGAQDKYPDFDSFAQSFVLEQEKFANTGRCECVNPDGYTIKDQFKNKQLDSWNVFTPAGVIKGIATKEDALELCWKQYTGAPPCEVSGQQDTGGSDAQLGHGPSGDLPTDRRASLVAGVRESLFNMVYPISVGVIAQENHDTHREHIKQLIDKACAPYDAWSGGCDHEAFEKSMHAYSEHFESVTVHAPGFRDTLGSREGIVALHALLMCATRGYLNYGSLREEALAASSDG